MRLSVGRVLAAVVSTATCASSAGPATPPPPAPTVDVGADLRTYSGQAVSLTARVAPPGAAAGAYRWTLAWGDAAVDSGSVGATGMITASHSYAAVGQYALSLTGRSSSGATARDTASVVVETAGTPQVLIGAGDIGECGLGHVAKTAQIIDTIPGTVFTLGDNAYPNATATDYANCYDPYWGKFKKRTHPTPGNHEFQEYTRDSTGGGYFGYFGVAAGEPPRGYYSYELGDWHIIVLNSSFIESEPLGRVLAQQLNWLKADLAAHPTQCTLAMWHHPRFSSGTVHGSHANETLPMQPLWQALYDHDADVILAGHEHNYERFAPQKPNGAADSARGIREFVAGTGGAGYDSLDVAKLGTGNSEIGDERVHGVLKLTLSPGSYHWQFIPIPGYTFTDSGTAACH
jgi:hypothetical protein